MIAPHPGFARPPEGVQENLGAAQRSLVKVLHVGAEIFPLIKTGGLADVMGALPQALLARNADVRLLLPGMPAVMQGVIRQRQVCEIGPVFGAARVRLLLGEIEGSGVAAYVLDAPYLYRRQGNPYLAADGTEWSDNLQRFALLGWAAAHLASGELDADWAPALVHAHDWHAAMCCAYLAAHPGPAVGSVFTVHNLAYQGLFDANDYHLLGLPARFMEHHALEFHGQLSFMKAGLAYAQHVTTVSPTYAREMATEPFGFGLDGLIRVRGDNVTGILNGVDGSVWSPQTDKLIGATYSSQNLRGKADCKAALQRDLGLDVDAAAPLLAIVSRLTEQKGLDLLLQALPALVAHGAQLAVQGTGDSALEQAFTQAAAGHAGRVAARIAYDEASAHRTVAGADMILLPSRFEPCGLTQLYGLRYGTVPVVRRVGGLADTVVDATAQALASDTATGFVFGPAAAGALVDVVLRAIALYRQPTAWQAVMRRGMAQDFSWDHAAKDYIALYRTMLGRTDG